MIEAKLSRKSQDIHPALGFNGFSNPWEKHFGIVDSQGVPKLDFQVVGIPLFLLICQAYQKCNFLLLRLLFQTSVPTKGFWIS